MNKAEVRELATTLMDTFLVKTGISGWTFGFNNRHRAVGTCNYMKKEICLSNVHVAAMSEDEVRNTLLHEIAHAITPGDGHGQTWKTVAMALGAKPETSTELDTEPDFKWAIVDKEGNICKGYFRKPSPKTFRQVKFMFLPGRKDETLGTLEIVKLGK